MSATEASRTDMNVAEAVLSRRSTRAYLDRPVDAAVLRDILSSALRAPSGGNLQPWHIHVVQGETKDRLSRSIRERFAVTPAGESEDPQIYPEPLASPYKERRATSGMMLYDALKIARDDREARYVQMLKNFEFFGAPVGLIFTQPAAMVETQAVDLGILMMAVMLLAQERGLATCPQVSWRLWPKTLREVLGLPADTQVMTGMCLGYADPESPVANLVIPRDDVDAAVTWYR